MGEYLDKVVLEAQAEEFNQKYKEIFNKLSVMPKETQKERENRFKEMKEHPQYNAMVIDLMNVWRPQSYVRLENRLKNENNISRAFSSDDGIASTQKKEIDSLVFMESIKKAIEWYTGKNQEGKPYTFLQSVGIIYKHKVMKSAGENDFQKIGFVSGTNTKNLYNVLKLVRQVRKLCIEMNDYSDIDSVLELCVLKSRKYKYTKEEIKMAKQIVEGLDFVSSMDAALSEEDDTTFGDQREYIENGYLDIERQEWANSFKSNFEEKWELVTVSTSKVNLEWFKVFLSRDILVALKLEPVNEKERKENKDLLEPKCNSWCSMKNRCPYVTYRDGKKITSRDSCFIRYGEREGAEKNGDEEIYDLLEKIGNPFYKKVLENVYVKKAYREEVNSLYDLYHIKLKSRTPNTEGESFLFTDTILGNAIGESKKAVSVAKGKYEERRPMLCQIFKSVISGDDMDNEI